MHLSTVPKQSGASIICQATTSAAVVQTYETGGHVTQNLLIAWFGLIAVLFVIVLAMLLIFLTRARSRRKPAIDNVPAIDARQDQVAQRLGEQSPGQNGSDPRGPDVGGNFSNIAPRKDGEQSS